MVHADRNPDSISTFDPLAFAISKAEERECAALDELPYGTKLEVETDHHTYVVECRGKGDVRISGHPAYCPAPVPLTYLGTTDGLHLIKMWFIERGMRMDFLHPTLGVIRTSPVRKIHRLNAC